MSFKTIKELMYKIVVRFEVFSHIFRSMCVYLTTDMEYRAMTGRHGIFSNLMNKLGAIFNTFVLIKFSPRKGKNGKHAVLDNTLETWERAVGLRISGG